MMVADHSASDSKTLTKKGEAVNKRDDALHGIPGRLGTLTFGRG